MAVVRALTDKAYILTLEREKTPSFLDLRGTLFPQGTSVRHLPPVNLGFGIG